MNKMQIFDFLGMAKDGEVDNAQVQATMKAMAEKAAEMGKFPEANMELMKRAGPMSDMDAMMMRQNAPNPYAPVSYGMSNPAGPMTDMEVMMMRQGMPGQQTRGPAGPMTDADALMMRQYSPQNMSMQQIMTMLKRAGY